MIRKLLVLLLCLTAATATAKKPKSSASKKAESSAEKPKESDYDKLFKEKHTVADGMFRLHDVKGKLYFEIPSWPTWRRCRPSRSTDFIRLSS
jgi:hypothetical protein